MLEADITDILPAIRIPTLILYRSELDVQPTQLLLRDLPREAARLAEAIPDARVVPVPGSDAAPFVGRDVAEEIERFLRAPRAPQVPDRVLATVLFTDIAGSTEQAARLGDRAWADRLSAHRQEVRRQLARFRGDEVDTAGDGLFATFDGPARAISVAATAAPGEILVSATVKDLVAGSELAFDDRGAHRLKGVPGEWRLFAVR